MVCVESQDVCVCMYEKEGEKNRETFIKSECEWKK